MEPALTKKMLDAVGLQLAEENLDKVHAYLRHHALKANETLTARRLEVPASQTELQVLRRRPGASLSDLCRCGDVTGRLAGGYTFMCSYSYGTQ